MKKKVTYGNIWRILWKSGASRTGILFLALLVVLAVFADFIAGDKPILMRGPDGLSSPVLQHYAGALRHGEDYILQWDTKDATWIMYPPIPFAPSEIDPSVAGYTPPGTPSGVEKGGVHWLGTDQLGRDLTSGIIHGSRVALLIGILSIAIAFLAGIAIGSIAGFYGDHMLRWSPFRIVAVILSILVAWFYAGRIGEAVLSGIPFLWRALGSAAAFLLVLWLAMRSVGYLDKATGGRRRISIPVDLFIMRLLEVFKSIPGLFIILTILALVHKPGIWTLILLIGFLRWPSFARYIRAEYLALRDKPFVQNLRLYGQADWKIMWRHLLPNSLAPLIVLAAFGISSSIVLEATFSFLGIGLSPDHISWGSLINSARSNIAAWWLALFPGLAILCTVLSFNAIGRRLNALFTEQIRYTI